MSNKDCQMDINYVYYRKRIWSWRTWPQLITKWNTRDIATRRCWRSEDRREPWRRRRRRRRRWSFWKRRSLWTSSTCQTCHTGVFLFLPSSPYNNHPGKTPKLSTHYQFINVAWHSYTTHRFASFSSPTQQQPLTIMVFWRKKHSTHWYKTQSVLLSHNLYTLFVWLTVKDNMALWSWYKKLYIVLQRRRYQILVVRPVFKTYPDDSVTDV